MIHTLANFFRKSEKFAKDSGIYKQRKDWNTAKERRNLRSFDMKTSPPFFSFAFHGSYYPSELEKPISRDKII